MRRAALRAGLERKADRGAQVSLHTPGLQQHRVLHAMKEHALHIHLPLQYSHSLKLTLSYGFRRLELTPSYGF